MPASPDGGCSGCGTIGSPNGSISKNCRITDHGEALFQQLLVEAGAESSSEDNRFRVRLAFFKYLAPDTRIRLLEKRRAYLEERLSTITTSLSATRERFDTYTLSLMQHGRESTEQDIEWLNGLITAERRQSDQGREGTRRRRTRALRRKESAT